MMTWKRGVSLLLFLFAVYFVASSQTVIAPSGRNEGIPRWLASAPIPVLCLSPATRSGCSHVMAVWPIQANYWGAPYFPQGVPFQVVWHGPAHCTHLRPSTNRSRDHTITILECSNLKYQPTYQKADFYQINPSTRWRYLTLQNKKWLWQPIHAATWLTVGDAILPVFQPVTAPVPGSPILDKNESRTLGPLIRNPAWSAWSAWTSVKSFELYAYQPR